MAELRAERGWTQLQLSDEVYRFYPGGISTTQLSDYECGRKEPGLHIARAIADAFDVPLDSMVR